MKGLKSIGERALLERGARQYSVAGQTAPINYGGFSGPAAREKNNADWSSRDLRARSQLLMSHFMDWSKPLTASFTLRDGRSCGR
jgi:hypothetical protein